MTAYKLVVVDAFENYRRGDQILDQNLINKICDPKNELHHYERYVRKVLMNDAEMKALNNSFAVGEINPKSEPKQPEHKLHIESIKDEMDAE